MLKPAIGLSLLLIAPSLGCDDNASPSEDDVADTSAPEDDTAASDDADDDASTEDVSADVGPDDDASSEDVGEDIGRPDDASDDALASDVDDVQSSDLAEDTDDATQTDAADIEDDVPTAVTWAEIHPIFVASCGGCHGSNSPSGGSGGQSIGSADIDVAYDAAMLSADIAKCAGKTIAECALLRIEDGSMPPSGACRNPPSPSCPSTESQDLIQRWLDSGMLP